MTANKLFNYYLQATETEVSVQKLQRVQQILQSYQSCIILYTYDSIVIDIELSEIKIIREIQYLLENGNFPIKIKYGTTYNKMQELKR
jgi:hypothetical protein